MSTLTRGLILALALGCLVIPTRALSQTKTPRKAPTGSVSGRVTVRDKGRAGIVVGLRVIDGGIQTGTLLKATTDADGNYRILNVPAGNYQVTPIAPAFFVADTNSFGRAAKSLVMADGEIVEGIDFSILRGGVITGKVTQADGSPVIEERVIAVPANQSNLRSFSGPNSSFQTDDRGVYRIFGLSAGEYKVFVGRSEAALFSSANRGRPVYERVFYPDVSNMAEAKAIAVEEGGEVTGIDITVSPSASGFAATGVIVEGETNQPVVNIRFGLQKVSRGRSGPPMMGTVATSNQKGEFRLENLTPGKYTVFILPQQQVDLRADSTPFEIVDHDVSGLVLRTSKGASVSGRLVLENNTDKNVLAQVAQLRLFVYVRTESGSGSGFGQSSMLGSDGSFRLGGLQAGTANFQLSFQDRRTATGFVISRIEKDGVDYLRGLEIKPGEQISGVKIVVVHGTGIVRGGVKIENGPAPPEMRLVVRLVKPGATSSNLRAQEVDARGRFALEGVPAGTYDLHLSAFIPGSRARLPSTRQSVTVTDGAVTDVELVLDVTPNPEPKP